MENKPTLDQQLRKLRTMLYVRWFATKDCLNASMAFGFCPTRIRQVMACQGLLNFDLAGPPPRCPRCR